MYRIIIADDEVMECKVLEKIIFQKCPDAKILPGASNGIELISKVEQEHPDIAIVDINMPGLNGLDAIEIIHERHPEIKFLIVSAYSKFEYAQKALSFGASDYLLKPIKEKDFLSALQKIFHTISAEKQQKGESLELELMLENYRSAIENEFISSLIYDEIQEENMQKYFEILPQPFYGACIVSVRFLSDRKNADRNPAYQNFLIQMKTICTCLGKEQKNSLILCIFFYSDLLPENYRKYITENLKCILEKQKEFKQYAIGISSFKQNISELSNGIQESQFALYEKTAPGIYFWEPKEDAVYTSERNDCLLLIKQKQYKAFIKSLQKIIQKAEEQEEPFSYLQIYILDLMHTVFQTIPYIDSGYSLQEFITWIYWDKILHQQNYSGLYHITNWLLNQYLYDEEKEFPANPYILNSLSYISKHYMEELALETIAFQNNISSFYLSRLFKQELDHTFLELLTDIRISKALDYLYCENYSVQEISTLCGYINTSYFYKLFKKQTGMTIKKMRSLLSLVHPKQGKPASLPHIYKDFSII